MLFRILTLLLKLQTYHNPI